MVGEAEGSRGGAGGEGRREEGRGSSSRGRRGEGGAGLGGVLREEEETESVLGVLCGEGVCGVSVMCDGGVCGGGAV